jgi:carboxyl-terminal processing protease
MKKIIRLIFVFVFLFGQASLARDESTQPHSEDIYKNLDLFSKVLYLIEKDYVEPVKGQELIYGAIKGMLGTLDPYSVFLTPEVYKELKVDTVGRFGGVGLEITLQNGVLTVVSPIEDTPAARAGIRPGDRIIKINGKSTKGMDLADAVGRMRGSQKSKVTLTLRRLGVKAPFDVHLKRETIKIKSVKAEALPGGIAYLRLTNFQEKTTEELNTAIQGLAKNSKGKITGMVLDLRNNPGGLLEEAVRVSDLFLSSGVIVSTKGRQGFSEVRKANPDAEYPDIPMAVLINEGSASASEIVAAALHDNKRAKLFGVKTFGKGSVQTVVDLGEGTGLKLTIAKYYTPADKSITGTGVTPDFEIRSKDESKPPFLMTPEEDVQRQAALEYLKTGKTPPPPPKATESKKEEPEEENHSELE